MSHPPSQDMSNHARYVPLFHFVAGPIFLINLIYSIVMAIRNPVLDNIVGVLVSFALVALFLTVRRFATTVQDRVIRLEEQLRFERLFPDDLRNRIPEFTRDQFAALRFASDSELPDLARAVLDQRIHDRDAIKRMVKAWRADHLRV
ncbi:MAG TPA: DUF6526 family protein [Gemmatimonadales bacterium]